MNINDQHANIIAHILTIKSQLMQLQEDFTEFICNQEGIDYQTLKKLQDKTEKHISENKK